jgi:hypothetical protein
MNEDEKPRRLKMGKNGWIPWDAPDDAMPLACGQSRQDEKPDHGRVWRINAHPKQRKDGKRAEGWCARYGSHHPRQFLDEDYGGSEAESRRAATEWLWSESGKWAGYPGRPLRVLRWNREQVVDACWDVVNRLGAFRRMSLEQLKEECKARSLLGDDPIVELVEDAVMEVFDL